MSERRCFVPNCESTTGVRFPADEKVRCTWLDTLAIDHGVPEQEDFVCAEHFDASDVVVTGIVLLVGRFGCCSSGFCFNYAGKGELKVD